MSRVRINKHRLDREAVERITDAYRDRTTPIPRVQIRKSTYRDTQGFLVITSDGGRIFVQRREVAEKIRDAFKAGQGSKVNRIMREEYEARANADNFLSRGGVSTTPLSGKISTVDLIKRRAQRELDNFGNPEQVAARTASEVDRLTKIEGNRAVALEAYAKKLARGEVGNPTNPGGPYHIMLGEALLKNAKTIPENTKA